MSHGEVSPETFMTNDAQRHADAAFRTLERDEEQYIKAVRAIHEGRMDIAEANLLWDQLGKAHAAWFDSQRAKAST
jgi:hypothetical protein